MTKRKARATETTTAGSSSGLRQCAVSRTMKPREDLIRFVRDPHGHIVPDLRQRLPGRGVWVTADWAHLQQAVARNVFARAFRANVRLGKMFPDQVRELCERRALDLLALANKAGELVTGFEKVAAEIAAGRVAVLLHASDARPDGCRKLDAKFAARIGDAAATRTVRLHNVDNLSAVTGKANVVHAAMKSGGLARSYLQAARLLRRLAPPQAPQAEVADPDPALS